MEIERHLGPTCDGLDGGLGECELAVELGGGDRPRVEVLVREQGDVEIELQGREARSAISRALVAYASGV